MPLPAIFKFLDFSRFTKILPFSIFSKNNCFRQATEWPAGVSPAACPNYPYCDGLTAVVPLGYVNTAGYPAGVSAAVCPGYPYC